MFTTVEKLANQSIQLRTLYQMIVAAPKHPSAVMTLADNGWWLFAARRGNHCFHRGDAGHYLRS
jgi:hypothetical protein